MAQSHCPRCGTAFEYQEDLIVDTANSSELLPHLLSDSDPIHTCSQCGARIAIEIRISFTHTGLGIKANVRSPLPTGKLAAPATPELPRPIFVASRFALKYAIIKSPGFVSDMGWYIPATDWLNLLALWFEEQDWATLGPRLPQLLKDEAAATINRFLQESPPDGVSSIRLRAIAPRLHQLDSRFAPADRRPQEDIVDDQIRLLQLLAAQAPDSWEETLHSNIAIADPVAIQICWHQAEVHRSQQDGVNQSEAIAQLGLWLAMRFGSIYERAESAYQFATALSMSGQAEAGCHVFERALADYLECLSWHQPLECYKLIGDNWMLLLDDAAKAKEWYEDGLALARIWDMPKHVSSLAGNLARAELLTDNLSAAEASARMAIEACDGLEPEARQIRVAALDVIRSIKLRADNNPGALIVIRQMVEELRHNEDWSSLASMAEELVGPAIGEGDWDFAGKLLDDVLEHLSGDLNDGAPMLRPDRPQLMIGNRSSDEAFVLWRLGATVAMLAGDLAKASARFAMAIGLAKGNAEAQDLATLRHLHAGVLRDIGKIDDAVEEEQRSLQGHEHAATRLAQALAFAEDMLVLARFGRALRRGGGDLPGSEIPAARAALAVHGELNAAELRTVLGADATSDWIWNKATASCLLAWLVRREAGDLIEAVELCTAALDLAKESGNDACIVEVLEVMQFTQRDAGDLPKSVDAVCQLVDHVIAMDLETATESESRSRRRWLLNNGMLPGVSMPPGTTGEKMTAPIPTDADELMRWLANSSRLPGVAMLSLREHGGALEREQMNKLTEGKHFMMPRNLGNQRNLRGEALEWQMSVLAQGGSIHAMPDRWLDTLIGGLMTLVVAAGGRPTWMAPEEANKLVQNGYMRVLGALYALGRFRLALSYCSLPPGCRRPATYPSSLVLRTFEPDEFTEAWDFAASTALEIGDRVFAGHVIQYGLAWALAHQDSEREIRFRFLRSAWLDAEGRLAEAKEELRRSRELALQLPESQTRKGLLDQIGKLANLQEPVDLQRDERHLLVLKATEIDQTGTSADDEVERLLALSDAQIGFGRIPEARQAVELAAALVEKLGLASLRARIGFARGKVAFAAGEHEDAILIMEDCLAAEERSAEPDQRRVARILGLLGIYRCNHAQSLGLDTAEVARLPELSKALSELERSLNIHRKVGDWRDVTVNLSNLGLLHWLQLNPIDQVRCYLEALDLCAEFHANAPPAIRYPQTCFRLWANLSSVCRLFGWFPEAPVISRYCLTTLSNIFRGLIADENQLLAMPERSQLIPFALQINWLWINDAPARGVEVGQKDPSWVAVGKLRLDILQTCLKYGMKFNGTAFALPRSLQRVLPGPAPRRSWRELLAPASWLRADWNRPPDPDARLQLRREFFELVEDTKARTLRAQLGGALSPPRSLSDHLRDDERVANDAWIAVRNRCSANVENSADLESLVRECWSRYEDLTAIWRRMEHLGGDIAEYARLRNGHAPTFGEIKSLLAG